MTNAITAAIAAANAPVPPPMRGIRQAISELRAADPNTALTERALRRLVLSAELPSVKVGRKYLINMNVLNSYLSGEYGPIKPVQTTQVGYGTIRPVHI